MINIKFRTLTDGSAYDKNVLYKIDSSRTVIFTEIHRKSCEKVYLTYDLKGRQYGIFAHEYRSPATEKEGTKRADILSCLVDPDRKKINTDIFDVKSNISAFSDDLTQNNAMMTAITEIRDFIEQIHHALLHKDSFMLYYKDDDYSETERVGIITKNFDSEKLTAVADRLLRPFRGEAQKIRDFARRIIYINGKDYRLYVIILKKVSETEYEGIIKVGETAD